MSESPRTSTRTPDYQIRLKTVEVVCEIKQINPNAEDKAELEHFRNGEGSAGRWVPNRFREVLNDCDQLRPSSRNGLATLLVVYDNTLFRAYTKQLDVVMAMFGHHSVAITIHSDAPDAPMTVSEPFFGGKRGFTPDQNTSVSGIAILDDSPSGDASLCVYYNPFARVPLSAAVFDGLPVTHYGAPGSTTISLD